MVSRDFRPPLFSPEDGTWRMLSIGVLIGSAALSTWLATTEPEPSNYSAAAWVDLPVPINQLNQTNSDPPRASLESHEDTAAPLMEQLLKEAESGKIRPALLLETFMEAEESHGGDDAQLLMREFLNRSRTYVDPRDPIEGLADQKAQMLSDPDLVYVSKAFTLTDVLVHDQLQCQSSSMTVALAWLQQEITQSPAGPRPVLVMSPNHVQPGLLLEGTLHLMEATSRGDRVASLQLAELEDVRILDAADALTWTLLQDDTPDRIRDRMTLFSSHIGDWRFTPGSGSDSWLHLPHTFGEPIVLSSRSRELSENTDPAKMLEPTAARSEDPAAEGSPIGSSEPFTLNAPPMESRMLLEPSLSSGERVLECPCKEPGVIYPILGEDPCFGLRRTPSGEICSASLETR